MTIKELKKRLERAILNQEMKSDTFSRMAERAKREKKETIARWAQEISSYAGSKKLAYQATLSAIHNDTFFLDLDGEE